MANILVVTGEEFTSLRNQADIMVNQFRKSGHETRIVFFNKPFRPPKADLMIYFLPFFSNFVQHLTFWDHHSRCRAFVYYTMVEGVNHKCGRLNPVLKWRYIIAPSKFSKNMIEEAGVECKEVIPHQINLPLTVNHEYGRAWRSRFPKDKKVILSNNINIVRKGLDRLRKAVDILASKRNDFVVIIHTQDNSGYGCTPLETLEGANTIVEPEFHKLTYPQVLGKMAYADIIVNSSYGEGFGMPIVEALALGKPLVCANSHAVNEIATPENSFMVGVTWDEEFIWYRECAFKMSVYNPKDLAHQLELSLDASPKEIEEKRKKGFEALKRLENSYDTFLKFIP